MLGTASEVGDVSRDFLSLFRIYQSAIIFINGMLLSGELNIRYANLTS